MGGGVGLRTTIIFSQQVNIWRHLWPTSILRCFMWFCGSFFKRCFIALDMPRTVKGFTNYRVVGFFSYCTLKIKTINFYMTHSNSEFYKCSQMRLNIWLWLFVIRSILSQYSPSLPSPISSTFSRNSEADASECLENLKEIFFLFYMFSDVSRKSSIHNSMSTISKGLKTIIS